MTLRCTTLSTELANANIAHVDFLSLDLEGHELPALSSVDFTKTTIDIIMCEDKTVWRASPDGPGGCRRFAQPLTNWGCRPFTAASPGAITCSTAQGLSGAPE